MTRRQVLPVGALVWAVAGAAVAWSSLTSVDADARALVGAASMVGPAMAVGAALELDRAAHRIAGALLLGSAVVTPTYLAYAINLPALLAGTVLVVAPGAVTPRSAVDGARRATVGDGHPAR